MLVSPLFSLNPKPLNPKPYRAPKGAPALAPGSERVSGFGYLEAGSFKGPFRGIYSSIRV